MSFLEKDNDIRKLSQVDDDVDAELLIDKTAENGYIQFSVLVKPTANIEAADLFTINGNYMLQTVLNTTTKILCQKTDYLFVVQDRDACGRTAAPNDSTRLNALNKDIEISVKDVKQPIPLKSDEFSLGEALTAETKYIKWLEFSFRYSILQVASADDSASNVYDVMTSVVAESIHNKEMTQLLRWWNAKVLMASAIGEEMDNFLPWVEVFGSWEEGAKVVRPNYSDPIYQQLNPAPMHPIRLAGILLLSFTIMSVVVLISLAKRRRLQREAVQSDKASANVPKDDLRTDEGLTDMLDRGKQESLRRRGETA